MEAKLRSPAKCELRSVIRFFNAKKVPPIEIHRQLVQVYGEKCMDVKNVRKWCREFSEGRENVHDEQRLGRPSLPDSLTTRIEEMVLSNRRITLHEIVEGLNEECSFFTVQNIVSEVLGYNKVSARWVLRQLTEEHKRKRVECATKCRLRRYDEEGEEFLDSIVTGDLTWALKKHLGGQQFKSDDEVQEAVESWLSDAAGEWYDAGIRKLISRLKKVIDRQGDYVEK